MSLLEHRTFKPRGTIDPDAVMTLGREFAEWRLTGCPGYGFQKVIGAKVRKVAKACGVSYAELWAHVHKAAYEMIDADGRSSFGSSRKGSAS